MMSSCTKLACVFEKVIVTPTEIVTPKHKFRRVIQDSVSNGGGLPPSWMGCLRSIDLNAIIQDALRFQRAQPLPRGRGTLKDAVLVKRPANQSARITAFVIGRNVSSCIIQRPRGRHIDVANSIAIPCTFRGFPGVAAAAN